MATEDTSKAAEPEPTPAPATPVTPEPVPVEPVKHVHSRTVLDTCDELGISREFAETTDPAGLRQEISDARMLADVRRAKRPATPTAPAAEETDEDEEYVIPPEVETELENTPHTKRLIKALGKDAIKGRKAAAQVKEVRQQTQNQSVEARGNAVLATIPLPPGVDRQTRDQVVWSMAASLDRQGLLGNLTVEQAVHEIAKKCFPTAGQSAAAAVPRAPVKPVPTTTARPTNRLAPALQGQIDHLDGNTKDDFVP